MVKTVFLQIRHFVVLLSLATLLGLVGQGAAQVTQTRDNDTTRQELGSFDGFMDGHPEIAEQLQKDPSLIRDKEFVKNHPALQQYLQEHPAVREEISENPSQFMRQERRFERWETRKELTNLDQFLDTHPEIAEQLQRDPSLVNDKKFVKDHPALKEFLDQHGGVAQELRQNPQAFMQQERRFDRREDRFDGDTTRGQLASVDRFLDSHPEIAEQLRKNPSLVNDKEFVAKHPELQSYLQQHPGVREEFTENPNAFMRQERRFDRQEDRWNRGERWDNDTTRGELASMDRFLDSHPEIAEQLRKDPSLVSNREFVEKHPELQTYLQQHPAVREEFTENPNAFMRQERRFERHEGFEGNNRFDRHDGFEGNARFEREGEREEMASFGQFLGVHANIAQQVSKDPSLLNNKEYMENHPDLQAYLQAHPGMQRELKENPQAVLQSMPQQNQAAPKTATVQKPAQKQH